MMSSADQPLPPAPKGSLIFVHEWSGATVIEFPHTREAGPGWKPPLWLAPALFGLVAPFAFVFAALLPQPMPDGVLIGLAFVLACVLAAALFAGVCVIMLGSRRAGHDGLSQLRVNLNSLTRVSASGAREVWPRHDLLDVRCEIAEKAEGHRLGVYLRDRHGEREHLYGSVAYRDTDPFRRAELEWLAALLRNALHLAEQAPRETLAVPPLPGDAVRGDAAPKPAPSDAIVPRREGR